MNIWLGLTDYEWFTFLREKRAEEVNFWSPSGNVNFKALSPGEPFLFKLKSPHFKVVGGGFFVRYMTLPLSFAWKAFGEKNGTDDYIHLRKKILNYRSGQRVADPEIGCVILTDTFFFEEDLWIDAPDNWSKNIVRGKTYNTADAIGQNLWQQVQERLRFLYQEQPSITEQPSLPLFETEPAYAESNVKRRLGQGAFRALVADAYGRRCAATGEKTLPVLEAAHIKPYAHAGPHDVRNGLLLRSDVHTLFDLGYVTVTPDYHLEVSPRIREEYSNGRIYYALHGNVIQLPEAEQDRPARTFLQWHNEEVFTA